MFHVMGIDSGTWQSIANEVAKEFGCSLDLAMASAVGDLVFIPRNSAGNLCATKVSIAYSGLREALRGLPLGSKAACTQAAKLLSAVCAMNDELANRRAHLREQEAAEANRKEAVAAAARKAVHMGLSWCKEDPIKPVTIFAGAAPPKEYSGFEALWNGRWLSNQASYFDVSKVATPAEEVKTTKQERGDCQGSSTTASESTADFARRRAYVQRVPFDSWLVGVKAAASKYCKNSVVFVCWSTNKAVANFRINWTGSPLKPLPVSVCVNTVARDLKGMSISAVTDAVELQVSGHLQQLVDQCPVPVGKFICSNWPDCTDECLGCGGDSK